MQQLPSAEVSLRLASPWSDQALARSSIMENGKDTGQIITGEVLEASVRWNDCTLLFVTDGIPFEDRLRIYLYSAGWKLLDSASIGAMYSTGRFTDLELAPPHRARFQFIDGMRWTLELLENGAMSLPFAEPKGVSRPLGLIRRFTLHTSPADRPISS